MRRDAASTCCARRRRIPMGPRDPIRTLCEYNLTTCVTEGVHVLYGLQGVMSHGSFLGIPRPTRLDFPNAVYHVAQPRQRQRNWPT